MENLKIIGALVVLLGSVILLIASVGLLRMPDVYNRIQVGTKASTLGTILILAGIWLIIPGWWTKLFILAIFILMTNPVSSHVLARAAYFIKIPLAKQTVVDKLSAETSGDEPENKD
jgi:multicomponent Na+:H+ antiporter subunit G